MSRDGLTNDFKTAAQAGTVRVALLIKVGTSGDDVYIWSGYGDLSYDGNTYTGVGTFGGISPVEETNDIYATGVEFSLSGVPSSMISVALGEMEQGREAKAWLALFNSDLELISDPYLLFEGLTDVPTIDDPGGDATIRISAESRLIRLETPNIRRYTSEDQKIDYPTDKGFDYVPSLQDKEITWGR